MNSVRQSFSHRGRAHQGRCNAMLEGARMTLGNKDSNIIFIDHGLLYSEWGCEMFSLSIGGPYGS